MRLVVEEGVVSAGEVRLSGQDLAFLAWESPETPMHVAVRGEFRAATGGRAPDLATLRRAIAERVRPEPRLSCRLARRGWRRRPVWVPADAVHVEDHVGVLYPSPDTDERARIDALLRLPMDLSRPPWEVWLVPDPLDVRAFSLLVKIHHALVDGASGVALLERLLGGGDAPPRGVPAAPREADVPRRARPRAGLRRTLRFVREHFRRSPDTPLNGSAASRRHRTLDADAAAFDQAAARLRGTHNDLLLACVSGALRHWLVREMGPPTPDSLRAFCPVDLRRRGEAAGHGNRIAPWLVPLPLEASDAATRVERIRAWTRRARRDRAQLGGDGMARWIPRLGRWVAGLGMALAARRRAWSIVVTNVPGPGRPLELCGARCRRLFAFAPLFPGQRVSVAAVRYEGRLCFGIVDGFGDDARGRRLRAELAEELDAVLQPRLGEHAA